MILRITVTIEGEPVGTPQPMGDAAMEECFYLNTLGRQAKELVESFRQTSFKNSAVSIGVREEV